MGLEIGPILVSVSINVVSLLGCVTAAEDAGEDVRGKYGRSDRRVRGDDTERRSGPAGDPEEDSGGEP